MVSASDPLGWSLEEIRSQWIQAPVSGFLNHSEFSLTKRLTPNALPLADCEFKASLTDKSDCLRCGSGQEETDLHVFY